MRPLSETISPSGVNDRGGRSVAIPEPSNKGATADSGSSCGCKTVVSLVQDLGRVPKGQAFGMSTALLGIVVTLIGLQDEPFAMAKVHETSRGGSSITPALIDPLLGAGGFSLTSLLGAFGAEGSTDDGRTGPSKGVAAVPSNKLVHTGSGSAHPPRIRSLSVFGNNDHELGHKFANGEIYTKDVVAFASNEFPLNSRVTVTTPDGNKLTAPVKDRMAKRFSRSRIDATLACWKQLSSRGYGLVRGCRVEVAR